MIRSASDGEPVTKEIRGGFRTGVDGRPVLLSFHQKGIIVAKDGTIGVYDIHSLAS